MQVTLGTSTDAAISVSLLFAPQRHTCLGSCQGGSKWGMVKTGVHGTTLFGAVRRRRKSLTRRKALVILGAHARPKSGFSDEPTWRYTEAWLSVLGCSASVFLCMPTSLPDNHEDFG